VEIRAHVVFKGRVQGVFFRASTRDLARKEGVSGWVRNLQDGSVEALFEGPKAKVLRVVELCKTSFPNAQVDSADVDISRSQGVFKGFEIKR
jgi:acylphosphatase